jgi:two-component system, chemotaxis family, chemotaxis protein CheY
MIKILIVDDSNLSRKILKKILSQEDYNVIEADNGLRAIELYFIEKPNVVLLDISMPDLSGFEVLEKICSLDANAKVIMATADLQDLTIKESQEIGAIAYITKPFVREKVLETLHQICSHF